jgi:hypothetical protein
VSEESAFVAPWPAAKLGADQTIVVLFAKIKNLASV